MRGCRPSTAGTKSVHLAASFNKDYSSVQELDGPDAAGFFTATVVVPASQYEYNYNCN